jgi:hypothetical protein
MNLSDIPIQWPCWPAAEDVAWASELSVTPDGGVGARGGSTPRSASGSVSREVAAMVAWSSVGGDEGEGGKGSREDGWGIGYSMTGSPSSVD